GYYYTPWITPYYYYPRPATWGFSVAYNPWTGWGFGMSWSSGPFHVGFYTGGGYHGRYWGGHRYYGPRGYRRSYNNIHIDNVNINRNRNYTTISNRNNIYRNNSQRANIQNTVNSRSLSQSDRQNIQNRKVGNQGGRAGTGATGAAAGNSRANNVMVDKKGNVQRNNNGQWQERKDGQWQNKAGLEKSPATRSTAQQRSSGYNKPSSIDRQHHSRQRATQRTQSHGGRSFGGGGRGGHR
ncbi:hypothetical protein JYU00_01575, partial [bacterium AH-315-N22]|nr:hypothetical protein [bacterium AH-315-N22]